VRKTKQRDWGKLIHGQAFKKLIEMRKSYSKKGEQRERER
jgi:hypothetical protein